MDTEVEFDLNPTDLYNYICDSDWKSALHCVDANPIEAKIWVVKREVGDFANGEIACRFLPLHSACARQPPLLIISSLIDAYPEGAAARDDNGMYPLHYACANQASSEVIHLLLSTFPEANFVRIETSGSLPVHLAAQWGVSTVNVMDILLENSISLSCAKDFHEKSPLEVALAAADYDHRKEVIHRLENAVERANADDMTSSTITTTTWSVQQDVRSKSREAETTIQENTVPHSTNKSITRMRAEIMALRAQREFIRAEADEQIAHEWKEVQNVISELTVLDESRSECRSTVEKVQRMNLSSSSPDIEREGAEDSDYSLDTEGKAELKKIVEENKGLKLEHERVKKVYEAYLTRVKTMHDAISELSKHTRKLITEQNNAHERVNIMESNMQVVSAWRQTRFQRMLREEKTYYSVVTDEKYETESAQRSELTEELVLQEMELVNEYDSILNELNNL